MGDILGLVEDVEVGASVLGVALGIVVFFLTWRSAPKLSFPLQKRTLRLFSLIAVCFVLVEVASAAEDLLAPGTLEVLVMLARYAVEVVLALCVVLGAYALSRSEREEISRLRRSANTDELTSLNNRAFFRRAARRRLELSRKNSLPLVALVLDIDDFKPYNDHFGHEAGDAVLRCVGRVLRESIRADDLLARYGGEEFVMLTNGTLPEAAKVAERIRTTMEIACTPEHDIVLRRPITVSVGVAPLTAKTETLEDLLEAADKEMYRAKRAGKNRVYGIEEAS
jgi:diguanylate cyclase (GGDEF)-like protein